MKILAIETSCDETAAAVVEDGTKLISQTIASSSLDHAKTGGIIPEQAARKQIEYILPVLEQTIKKAFPETVSFKVPPPIDAIAVTIGPGLIGSLLVGVETAKTLAMLWGKPLIPVNHVLAHVYATWIDSQTSPKFPLMAIIVSGGHTDLILMKDHQTWDWLGGTRDDAAGEAFDKCARLLSLEYPGGPSIEKAAIKWRTSNPHHIYNLFPRGMAHDDNLDLSFSGLKAAVKRYLVANNNFDIHMVAAEVEEAIVDALINKTERAISKHKFASIVLSGGVSANTRLRQAFEEIITRKYPEIGLYVPSKILSTDNAAMISACAFFNQTTPMIQNISPNPELSIR